MLDGTEFVECACHLISHVTRYTLDLEDRVIYVETIYIKEPWYKRVWWALRNPTLAETLIGAEEAVKLRDMLNKLIEAARGKS